MLTLAYNHRGGTFLKIYLSENGSEKKFEKILKNPYNLPISTPPPLLTPSQQLICYEFLYSGIFVSIFYFQYQCLGKSEKNILDTNIVPLSITICHVFLPPFC